MSLSVFKIRLASAIPLLFLVFCLCNNLHGLGFSGDDKGNPPIKKYAFYTALKGDTPFSIAWKFCLPLEDFLKYNPELKSGIHQGDQVRIPTPFSIRQEGKPGGRRLVKYEVGRKETLYSIAKMFNTTQEEILKINPTVTGVLTKGTILTIPDTNPPETIPAKEVVAQKEIINPKPEVPQKNVIPQKDAMPPKIVAAPKEITTPVVSTSPKIITTPKEVSAPKDIPISKLASTPNVVNSPAEINPPKSAQPKTYQQEPLTYSEYTIAKGDNYYQLSQRFGFSQTDLEQLNPALKEGFKLGMVLRLPLKKSADLSNNHEPSTEIKSEPAKMDKSSVTQIPAMVPNLNKTFDIGIFLPFCQNLSDSARISLHSNNFIEFYSGVLLATEKLTKSGMKLKLFVYDTYHDSGVVNVLVKRPEFLSLDLIIGPVYPNDQKIITELSYKNHIPVVSPLSPDTRFVSTTPGYYLINPGKRLRLSCTVDYVTTNFPGQNVVLLNHGANSDDELFLLERLSRKIGKVKSYNILTEEALGLEELVKDSLENIFVLAEGSEANVSVAMTRLNTLTKSHKIKVIGLQEYTKMQSIDVESFHNTNLHFVSPYFIDYENPKVNNFIGNYRLAFSSEPTQYSFQGYDVALHFMASLGKGGKGFPSTNPNPGVELLQAEYDFSKVSPLGGNINRMLYVIEYTNNYDVRVVEKIKGILQSDHAEGRESE